MDFDERSMPERYENHLAIKVEDKISFRLGHVGHVAQCSYVLGCTLRTQSPDIREFPSKRMFLSESKNVRATQKQRRDLVIQRE
jgi:hypothetical protein